MSIVRHPILIYILFILPCLFSSALILPEFFSPFRVPLYLISIISIIPFLHTAHIQIKKIVIVLICTLFFAVILSGFWVEEYQFAVNIRQWAVYSSLYICGIIGVVVVKILRKQSPRFVEPMLILFSLLFLYGIYTYYAQEYGFPEFLYLLRPSPAIDSYNIYSQAFAGWSSSSRAYSVWYEPSYSSLVLSCSIPLLYFSARTWIKVVFIALLLPYTYLTFSRSAWLICVFFIVGHISGFFGIKINRIRLIIMAISIAILISASQILFVDTYDEISALIRIKSTFNGVLEWLDNPLLGTGQAELLTPISALGDIIHIHSTIPTMLHWYGLIGLLIVLIPYWYIVGNVRGSKNKVISSFVYLSVLAISIGGSLMMMSIFWFFWGFYMNANQKVCSRT